MTAGQVQTPAQDEALGYLGSPSLSDVLRVVTDSDHVHLGFPPGVAIDFPTSTLPAPRLLPEGTALRPGDRYLFTVGQLLTAIAGFDHQLPPGLGALLEALGLTAAAEVVTVVGVAPLRWTVPTRGVSKMASHVPAHVRMVFSGVFGTAAAPAESWTWGLRAGTSSLPQDQGALDTMAALMKAQWIANLKPITAQNITLTQCLYARVAAGGHIEKTDEGVFRQSKLACSEVGTNTQTTVLPLQTALVVSLGSARAGATGKGRVFLPYQNANTLFPDFRINVSQAQQHSDAIRAMIVALNAPFGPVSIISGGVKTAGAPDGRGPGYTSRVTGTRCGRVLDTMRSRRDALVEGYVLSASIT